MTRVTYSPYGSHPVTSMIVRPCRIWLKDSGANCSVTVVLQRIGVQLITKLKRNMRNKLLPLWDKLLLRKRALIESVGEQLEHVCQIGHTRHRRVPNAFVHAFAALVAYSWQERKPS